MHPSNNPFNNKRVKIICLIIFVFILSGCSKSKDNNSLSKYNEHIFYKISPELNVEGKYFDVKVFNYSPFTNETLVIIIHIKDLKKYEENNCKYSIRAYTGDLEGAHEILNMQMQEDFEKGLGKNEKLELLFKYQYFIGLEKVDSRLINEENGFYLSLEIGDKKDVLHIKPDVMKIFELQRDIRTYDKKIGVENESTDIYYYNLLYLNDKSQWYKEMENLYSSEINFESWSYYQLFSNAINDPENNEMVNNVLLKFLDKKMIMAAMLPEETNKLNNKIQLNNK